MKKNLHLSCYSQDKSIRGYIKLQNLMNFPRCYHSIICFRIHRYESNFFPNYLIEFGKQHFEISFEGPQCHIKVANRAVAMDARARLLCYPRGSFYPLSPVPPMWYRGITKTYFRTCSARRPCSQAGLNLCAFPTVSIRSKPTFVPLRYNLAGYRPSKTARLTLSPPSSSDGLGEICHIPKRGLTLLIALPPITWQLKCTNQYQTTVKLHGVFLSRWN